MSSVGEKRVGERDYERISVGLEESHSSVGVREIRIIERSINISGHIIRIESASSGRTLAQHLIGEIKHGTLGIRAFGGESTLLVGILIEIVGGERKGGKRHIIVSDV